MRRAILEVLEGPDAGRCVALPHGDTVRAGSALDCEIPLLGDTLIAKKQFAIAGDGESWSLFHLDGAETIVNGEPVLAQRLAHLDRILAGETLFRFFVLGGPEPNAPGAPTDRLCASLSAMQKPLFALADTALEPWIVAAAKEADAPAAHLLLGHTEEQITTARPWLFSLTGETALLQQLVRGCWSRGRVVFLCADETLPDLASALRPFLFFDGGNGELVDFRFFDPRALRALLPNLTPAYLDAFFTAAPVVMAEDSRPRFLKMFYGGSRGARSVRVPLVPDAIYLPTQLDIRDRLRAVDPDVPLILAEFGPVPESPETLLAEASGRGLRSVEARLQYVVVKMSLGADAPLDQIWTANANRDAALDRFVDRWNLRRAL